MFSRTTHGQTVSRTYRSPPHSGGDCAMSFRRLLNCLTAHLAPIALVVAGAANAWAQVAQLPAAPNSPMPAPPSNTVPLMLPPVSVAAPVAQMPTAPSFDPGKPILVL